MFSAYLKLGLEHILDSQGYDHILFIIVLSVMYRIKDWKKILILVTAFTIGHSLTLALSTLDMIKIEKDLVESLIPLTILVTAIFNIFHSPKRKAKIQWNYAIALIFGLVHGLGYSNYFKPIIGKEDSLILPLATFNIGIELGQMLVVFITLLVGYLFVLLTPFQHRIWKNVVSAVIAVWAIYLMCI